MIVELTVKMKAEIKLPEGTDLSQLFIDVPTWIDITVRLCNPTTASTVVGTVHTHDTIEAREVED